MSELLERQRFLACLSDPSRFTMVTTLLAGPRCVTELASLVGLSQSCTTRHLQVLQREGIVAGERQGKRVIFGLRTNAMGDHPVLQWALQSPPPTTSGSESGRKSRSSRSGSRPRPGPARPTGTPAVEIAAAGQAPVHESGWAADTGAPAAEAEAGKDEGVEEDRERVAGRPSWPRPTMDDFLL